MILKTVWFAFAALGLSFVASAQVRPFPPSDPNVIWPKCSVPQPGEKPGTPHTMYCIYVGPWSHPTIDNPFPLLAGLGGKPATGPSGYHPVDIHNAYAIPMDSGHGAIAVVLWNDQPNILNDFNTFSAQFGLPVEKSTNRTASTNKTFQVVYASGSQPPPDSGAGYEESLDAEWTHAMAPNAKIYLVEAASGAISDLMIAEQVAASLPGVSEVSNSWIAYGEFQGENQLDSNFVANKVLFLSGSGDIGGLQGWPAESPNVMCIGGTSLNMNGATVTSETAWGGSGGGFSLYESRPAFQNRISNLVGAVRGNPDLAAVADPYTGVAIYDTYGSGGWSVVGGTSVATPVTAGMMNSRGYTEAGSAAALTRYYALPSNTKYLRDIVSGTAGTFSATPGWDFVTGLGAPVGLLPAPIQNVPFSPATVSVYGGTRVSGTLSSLTSLDGSYYVVQSKPLAGTGQVAGVEASFNVAFSNPLGAPVQSATLNLTGTSPGISTVGFWFQNINTGAFDFIKFIPLGATSTTASLTINPALYITSSGSFTVVARSDWPMHSGAMPSSFQFKIDQMQVLATPVQN